MKRFMILFVLLFLVVAAIAAAVHKCDDAISIVRYEKVGETPIGRRLHVRLNHGDRKSGWLIPVNYPEWYLTNGEQTAEAALREHRKSQCFCKGEWWLETNGWVEAKHVVTRRILKCSVCGRNRASVFTNTVPVDVENPIAERR